MVLLIQLMQGDCLEEMKKVPTDSVDLILCDPPYGTIKGMKLNGRESRTEWDNVVDTKKLFAEFKRILRVKGKAVIFSQEPYTSELKNNTDTAFIHSYDLIWDKQHFGNPFSAKKETVKHV